MRGESIRINCGGNEEYEGVDGKRWSRDRFFVRGVPVWSEMYGDRIGGTEDDSLYAEWRYFQRSPGTDDAYRVPLPPGRYRVTFHFAEAFSVVKSTPETRHGDFKLQGETVLKDYSPAPHVGFATVDLRAFDIPVEDGMLHIGVVDGRTPFFPSLSAFEIERLE